MIIAAIGLVSKFLEYLNTKNSRKYIDELVQIKTDILEEEKKQYWSDDAKLEELYSKLKIIFDAVEQEIQLKK